MTDYRLFDRPPVFKFTIGDRVEVKDHLHLRATRCTKKSYELTYPEGFMIADLVWGIRGPDYHCEPIAKTSQARVMWIEETYLQPLDNV
jgi:hypothetical protein